MFNSISLTLYTQENCNYCHELKKKLAAWDFKWHEINISYDLFAKDFLKDKLKNAEKIVIKTHKGEETGKFGRILGEIFCDNVNINQQMCDVGHAVAYYGQSKDDIQEEHIKNRKILGYIGLE